MNSKDWYQQEIGDIFKYYATSDHGLSKEEVLNRVKKYGRNVLPEAKPDSYWFIFGRQFRSPLIYVLILAAVIVFLLGEYIDAGVIAFVLFFNAVIGTFQEGKAQNTLLAIKNFTHSESTVMRDGKEYILDNTEVVPGDVLILQEGEKVAADARVIEATTLAIDESALTGESEPVYKSVPAIPADNLATPDRKNMVWKGTNVANGHGKAIVVATGEQTQIGKITAQVAAIDTEIPLQADIRKLARIIIILVFVLVVVFFFYGVYTGIDRLEMFKIVVSMAVSLVPEGLPVVMTVVLATGVWRMSKRNALVKKLQAVEALGQAKIIAIDKTGTVTKNELSVVGFYSADNIFKITGSGYEPKGEIMIGTETIESLNHDDLLLAGKISCLTAGARLSFAGNTNQWKVSGDPTEGAMLVFAKKVGFEKNDLIKELPQVLEEPFSYVKKYHLTGHKLGEKIFIAVAGAPEVILEKARSLWLGGKQVDLEYKFRIEQQKLVTSLSQKGLRVLALAFKEIDSSAKIDDRLSENLVYAGVLTMEDSLRPEVIQAVSDAKMAGMKIVMITGDNKNTAMSIAGQIGVWKEGDEVLTGPEIESLEPAQLAGLLDHVTVFARVTPENKLKIIQAYRLRKEIIAMTGDGVNDAPSLVAADLGVAMGKIGTEVAKEAADIVLLDDNFGSIVAAIEEGRNIYRSVRRVILYLFSTSVGEVLIIGGAIVLGWPLPLLAVQIIWLNLVTDGFLNVGLAMEPKSGNLITEGERKEKQLLSPGLLARIVFLAIPMGVMSLLVFRFYLDFAPAKALTASLTIMAVMQWLNAWNCRFRTRSIFLGKTFSNKYLIGATAIVVTLQLLAIYTPFLQSILSTVELNLIDWVGIISASLVIIIAEEIRKLVVVNVRKVRF